jgi:hypothetical protein
MIDLTRSQLWRGVVDASLSLFDVLEDAIDPASWPPGWELQYTDHTPEPAGLASVGGKIRAV